MRPTVQNPEISWKRFDNFYLIPEGGSNLLAVKGVCEFASKLDVPYDYLCCAVGTGGTLSGLIEGVPSRKKNYWISDAEGCRIFN